jgi:hypothetical protein
MAVSRTVFAPVLVVALLSGCCPWLSLPEAQLPDDGPPIKTSVADAQRFVDKMKEAGETLDATKELDLAITQEEITSFLGIGAKVSEQMQVLGVKDSGELVKLKGDEDFQRIEGFQELVELIEGPEGAGGRAVAEMSLRLPLQEPQVYFKESGEVAIRGYAEIAGQRQPFRLVIAPKTVDGNLVLDFVEGQFGPVPIPKELADQVFDQMALGFAAADTAIQFKDVKVGAGTFSISGALK